MPIGCERVSTHFGKSGMLYVLHAGVEAVGSGICH